MSLRSPVTHGATSEAKKPQVFASPKVVPSISGGTASAKSASERREEAPDGRTRQEQQQGEPEGAAPEIESNAHGHRQNSHKRDG